MKKLFTLFFLLMMAASCANQTSGDAVTEPTQTSATPTEAVTEVSSPAPVANQETETAEADTEAQTPPPAIATVTELVQGDIMCYATLMDENNTEHRVGATFEICNQSDQFLNKKVRLTYAEETVSDCQSSEPCGKTRQELLITNLEIIE